VCTRSEKTPDLLKFATTLVNSCSVIASKVTVELDRLQTALAGFSHRQQDLKAKGHSAN